MLDVINLIEEKRVIFIHEYGVEPNVICIGYSYIGDLLYQLDELGVDTSSELLEVRGLKTMLTMKPRSLEVALTSKEID